MRLPTAAVVIAGLALGGLAYGLQRYAGSADSFTQAAWAAGLVGTAPEAAEARQFLDRPTLIFFGYTHCPDFCPTALTAAGAMLADLGADADRVRVAFVTLDPERDTADVLRAYLAGFDPRILGFTGSANGIGAAARALRIQFARRGEGQDYAIDHTAAFILTDAQGRLSSALSYDATPEALAAAVRKSFAASPR